MLWLGVGTHKFELTGRRPLYDADRSARDPEGKDRAFGSCSPGPGAAMRLRPREFIAALGCSEHVAARWARITARVAPNGLLYGSTYRW